MKNEETIKTFTEITPLEALKLLVESGGEPISGLAYMDDQKGDDWDVISALTGVDPASKEPFKKVEGYSYERCATVTELDPCTAPDGCPELEPWMAFLGYGNYPLGAEECEDHNYFFCHEDREDEGWVRAGGPAGTCFRAIDVRTAWSQEHFPEHCRIRNYQEADPFEEFAAKNCLPFSFIIASGGDGRSLMREAYELGQANPNQPTK